MINSSSVESLKNEALALEPDARVQLAHSLVMSLEGLSRTRIAELWLAETERRDAEMDAGDVKGIPGEEVFARIESRHAE